MAEWIPNFLYGLYVKLLQYIPIKSQYHRSLYLLLLTSTGWPKSHFTLLKANKTKLNRAKKLGYISNERPDLGVFLLMKNSFIV